MTHFGDHCVETCGPEELSWLHEMVAEGDGVVAVAHAAQRGWADVLTSLVRTVDITNVVLPIDLAVSEKRVECVAILLRAGGEVSNDAVWEVCDRGTQDDLDILTLLLHAHPLYAQRALARAAQSGNCVFMRTALMFGARAVDCHFGLWQAVRYGHTDAVKLLLAEGVDPKRKDSCALYLACAHEKTDLIDILYPHSDPHVVLSRLAGNTKAKNILYTRIRADEERAILQVSVGGAPTNDLLARRGKI